MAGEFYDVNGTRLYADLSGPDGAPVVVLIHGFSLDTRMWDDQVGPLTERYRVLRYDLRGFGQSWVPEPGVYYEHQDDLRALLDLLGIDRVALVGLSLGGAVAIDCALCHPERISRLVVADSVLPGFEAPDLASLIGDIWRAGRSGGVEAARALWMECAFFASIRQQSALRDAVTQMVMAYSGWGWTEPDPGRWHQPAMNDHLSEVRCPTLVMVGEQDVEGMKRATAQLADQISDASLVELAGLGHLPNMEDPDAFNAPLLAFLDSGRW